MEMRKLELVGERGSDTPAADLLRKLEEAADGQTPTGPASYERRLYALLVDSNLLWSLPRAHWRRAADLGLIELVRGGAGGERND